MAEVPKKIRKPRIRKTAPTIREKMEAAEVKAAKEKPRRVRKLLAKIPNPFARLHLPNNKFVSKFIAVFKPIFRIIGKILRIIRKVLGWLVPSYFINSWREVRKVTWPNRRETWRLTAAVLIFSIVFGAMVSGVDKGLDEIFKHFVLK